MGRGSVWEGRARWRRCLSVTDRCGSASSARLANRTLPRFQTGSKPERFSWIGRAGCVFFRKSFVVRSIRASTIGLPSARASLSPRLAKESATPSLSSQLNRPGQPERCDGISRAGCAFFRKSFVVRSIRASTIGLPSARALLSPRLAKASATPSLSSQLNRSAKMGGVLAGGCGKKPQTL